MDNSSHGHPISSKLYRRRRIGETDRPTSPLPAPYTGSPHSPKADAIIIVPATFNTINKLANRIADNYGLDVANEAIGLGAPTAILPFVNSAYASRAPFRESIKKLRAEEVSALIGQDTFVLHEAGSGSSAFDSFPWPLAAEKAEEAL